MCGIAGIVNLQKQEIDRDLLNRMVNIIEYRGPDDKNFYYDETNSVALGHCRLSIIDLSIAGRQPMCNRDKSVWIIFNGEIYNYVEIRLELEKLGYKFESSTDTEVMIYAYQEWGEGCLKKFNGMFAFAIWDKRRHTLFCARDQVGIKPFYYYLDKDKIIFGSEIKQILEDKSIKRVANLQSISDYLSLQVVMGEETFFQGIKKLLPGHYFKLDIISGRFEVISYWKENLEPEYERTIDDFADEVRWLIEDAVKMQLRSDVPLGCYLSGGLDSSTVACSASNNYSGKLKLFTGKFKDGKGYDESNWAKLVANHVSGDYLETVPSLTSFEQLLPKLIWHMDEPAVGSGMFPQYFVSKLAGANVRVVLGGQGGDELFGGYSWYNRAKFEFLIGNKLFRSKNQTINNLRYIASYLTRNGVISSLKSTIENELPKDLDQIYYNLWSKNCFSEEDKKQLFITKNKFNSFEKYTKYFNCRSTSDIYQKFFAFDQSNFLTGLLQVEDRMSMAASLESRVPLLDHRLVQLSYKIPSSMKITNNSNKVVMRKAVKNYIPDEILNRKDKMGFPTPIDKWFKQQGSFIGQHLNPTGGFNEIFDKRHITKLLSDHRKGINDNSRKLWQILNINLWAEIFEVEVQE